MTSTDLNRTIRGTSKVGDHVLNSQDLARAQGFRNVSYNWWRKTRSILEVREYLESTRSERTRLVVSFREMEPDYLDDRLCIRVKDQTLFPDQHAAGQLGVTTGIGSHYPHQVLGKEIDGPDALAFAFANAWNQADATRRVVLHIHNESVIRGILPESHRAVRNDWYLGVLDRALPGARLSHWRGDDYTTECNVLIPDTIRAEPDSEYGAMISVSNSEIGKCLLRQLPSLFRAICMNGGVWGQKKGKAFTRSRRGVLDLATLEAELIKNIHEQIPLALSGVDRFLSTRSLQTDVSMKAVVAQVCKDHHLPKRLATSVLSAWWTERKDTPDLDNTLFAVINSITRAGQTHDNGTWRKFDILGGRLMGWDQDHWRDLVSRAAALNLKDVEAAFLPWELEESALSA